MLIQCPECQLQVSDKALSCPHCGYPLKSNPESRKQTKPNRRRRLPNGFGNITEIKGRNLRKPFRAMVTVGKNEATGRPIAKLLKPEAYFRTYNEAYEALVKYNRNPYDISSGITVKALYERWLPEYKKTVSTKTVANIESTWNKLAPIYSRSISDVKTKDCRILMDGIESTYAQKHVKNLLNKLFNYALEYELVDQNYAATVPVRGVVTAPMGDHKAFTKEELKILWENISDSTVRMILIQCYMGWRPRELCMIRTANVNLETWIITAGLKTDSGKDRQVPVIEKIKELVQSAYDQNKDYLFDNMTYDKYKSRFDKIVIKLNLDEHHKPHDPRKTFVTMCKEANVDEYAIKYLVGHRISDLTERVYTERRIEWLREEIEKLSKI